MPNRLIATVDPGSYVVLELALRERFVEFYASAIPLVSRDGSRQVLNVRDFDDFAEFVRSSGKKPPRLLTCEGASQMAMPLTLNPLLVWARHEGLLGGQRNRHVEAVLTAIRNGFAHGGYHIGMPGESARDIRDLAEIVNRLWGHLTPGGRLHPTPLAREAVVLGWRGLEAVTEFVSFPAEQLRWNGGDENENWMCVVVLAVPQDESLLDFDTRFEGTSYPADLLWGPGSCSAAQAWLSSTDVELDAVTYLDRIFAVQVLEGEAQPPRSTAALGALPQEQRGGTWHVVRADYPVDAQMHIAHGASGAQVGARCSCSAEDVASGTWEDVVQGLGTTAADQPEGPAFVRIPRFGEPSSACARATS